MGSRVVVPMRRSGRGRRPCRCGDRFCQSRRGPYWRPGKITLLRQKLQWLAPERELDPAVYADINQQVTYIENLIATCIRHIYDTHGIRPVDWSDRDLGVHNVLMWKTFHEIRRMREWLAGHEPPRFGR